MAVGARQADVRLQFLVEAVLLCCLGGLVGVALSGLGAVALNAAQSKLHVEVSGAALALAFAVSSPLAWCSAPSRTPCGALSPADALARRGMKTHRPFGAPDAGGLFAAPLQAPSAPVAPTAWQQAPAASASAIDAWRRPSCALCCNAPTPPTATRLLRYSCARRRPSGARGWFALQPQRWLNHSASRPVERSRAPAWSTSAASACQ